MAAHTGGSSITFKIDGALRQTVCFAGVCVPEETVRTAVVMLFGLLGLLLMVGLAHVYDGRSELEAERDRTRAEQRAFRQFARRVERMDAQSDGASGLQTGTGGVRGTDPPAALVSKPPDGGLDPVTNAYRETVMSVDHYEAEYGESLPTNVAAELSPEVAAALVGGGALTAQLKEALVEQSTQAAQRRDELLDAIEEEETALARAADRLEDLQETVDGLESAAFLPWSHAQLQDAFEDIQGVKEDIDELVQQRQDTVRVCPISGGRMEGEEFREFLYDSLDVSHPVLADATTLHDRAESVEHDIVRSLLRRT
jgi:type II secretory pathway pseudopilin PulG